MGVMFLAENLFDDTPALLPPGIYPVTLAGIHRRTRRAIKPNTARHAVVLRFLEEANRVEIERHCSLSRHPQSALVRLATEMHGQEIPSPVLSDGKAFTEFLQQFVGRKFVAVLGVSPCGAFNELSRLEFSDK